MGQFKKVSKNKVSIWNKNNIPYFNGTNQEFLEEEEIIVFSIPTGKMIEIYTSGKGDFKFSSDSRSEGSEDSQVGKYLEKYIYGKLSTIVSDLFEMPIHFYGFIGKKGFQGVDIYVNNNFLDWDLAKTFFNESGIKVIKEIYRGTYDGIELNVLESFIIRSLYEYPDSRSIFYRRKNTWQKIYFFI